ncbi:hypothetical protein [Gandjariella thermophila]|nr:hypothetical protein [Gandjariella thermophila]
MAAAIVGVHVAAGRLRALHVYGSHAAGAVEVDTTRLPSRTVRDMHGTLSEALTALAAARAVRASESHHDPALFDIDAGHLIHLRSCGDRGMAANRCVRPSHDVR